MTTPSWDQMARVGCLVLAACLSAPLAAAAAGQPLAGENRPSGIGPTTWVFEIPGQSLRTALQKWSEVTGLDWAHIGGSLEDLESPGVRGALSGAAALRQILAGTGLTYDVLPSGAIAIIRIEGAAAA